MPKSTITTEFHESLNVHGDFCPKFPFNLVFAVNDLPDGTDLVLAKLIRPCIKVYAGPVQDFLGRTSSYAVNVGQRYFYALIFW